MWACTSKRVNCTDFHPLHWYDARLRHSGPLRNWFAAPGIKTGGDIPGYHCSAEFYLNGVGWVPVDVSEAWKNPAKRDYFFGVHDANRVFYPRP
jgi:hypothetical protein